MVERFNSGIYQITNKVNGKRYIGSSINLLTRKNKHFRELRKNIHFNGHLQRSYNKHGKENFEFKILLYCNKKDLIFYEQRAIDSFNFKELYNLRIKAESNKGMKLSEEHKRNISKGNKGKIFSQETKKRISESKKGKPGLCGEKNGMYGKKMSNEWKKKRSESMIGEKNHFYGKTHTEKTKKKLSEKLSGENSPNFGKKMPKEQRKELSESRKGIKNPMYKKFGKENPNAKKIIQIDIYTGNVVKVWKSMIDASVSFRLNLSNLSKTCAGKQKTFGGFKWKHAPRYL